MKKIKNWLNDSIYLDPLSPACRMCSQGSKMVLFVTGLCSIKCYYCPLSFKKGGKDLIYADEWKLNNEYDTKKLIKEAELIDANGAGITGGDPLIVWERVKKYILLLKEIFGSKFHIHLYTTGIKNANHIVDLISAGLDEIRFHPSPEFWNNMDESPFKTPISNLLNTDADIAIEIPAIPNCETNTYSLVKWADEIGLKWINLNELEFSERNQGRLIKEGYRVKNDISAAAKGSEETAISIIKKAQKENLQIGIHYCSVAFKDGIQLKNRIMRRAKNIIKDYEIITEEGTIIKGIILTSKKSTDEILYLLNEKFSIPKKYFYLNKKQNIIEIGAWILEKIAEELKEIGYESYIIEEYPTADRLEVERIPMPL